MASKSECKIPCLEETGVSKKTGGCVTPDYPHFRGPGEPGGYRGHHRYHGYRVHGLFRLFVTSSLGVLLPLLLVLAGFSGCGFYSFTGASIPAEARTISVAYFPNDAPLVQPTLSQRFTDELQTKFLRQTNLRLVEDDGDLHFDGAITGYSTMPTAIAGDDRAALNRLTISVRVRFFNEYDEKSNFERTFSRFYDYPSELSLSQIENEAIDVIIEALVEDIFNQAVVNW